MVLSLWEVGEEDAVLVGVEEELEIVRVLDDEIEELVGGDCCCCCPVGCGGVVFSIVGFALFRGLTGWVAVSPIVPFGLV